MNEQTLLQNDLELHEFMLAYQREYGAPPRLCDMRLVHGKCNHRSSIYYALHRLIACGKVQEVKPARYRRRYEAI